MSTKRALSIQAWMKLKGISKRKLAIMAGLNEKTVIRLTNPDYTGHADSYDRIAEALGITPTQLLAGPDESVIEQEE